MFVITQFQTPWEIHIPIQRYTEETIHRTKRNAIKYFCHAVSFIGFPLSSTCHDIGFKEQQSVNSSSPHFDATLVTELEYKLVRKGVKSACFVSVTWVSYRLAQKARQTIIFIKFLSTYFSWDFRISRSSWSSTSLQCMLKSLAKRIANYIDKRLLFLLHM